LKGCEKYYKEAKASGICVFFWQLAEQLQSSLLAFFRYASSSPSVAGLSHSYSILKMIIFCLFDPAVLRRMQVASDGYSRLATYHL
jgi:hypothetical protein